MVLKLCSVPDEIEDAQPGAFKESKAAAYCGMGIDKFRSYVHSGRIPARAETGGARLYLRLDLDSFLQSLPIDETAVRTPRP